MIIASIGCEKSGGVDLEEGCRGEVVRRRCFRGRFRPNNHPGWIPALRELRSPSRGLFEA